MDYTGSFILIKIGAVAGWNIFERKGKGHWSPRQRHYWHCQRHSGRSLVRSVGARWLNSDRYSRSCGVTIFGLDYHKV